MTGNPLRCSWCFIWTVLFLGCGERQEAGAPATAAGEEGLTFEVASPGRGLSGTFAKGGHIVYFQAARGERNPDQELAAAPGTPEFAVNARFMDAERRTFAIQIGGDEFGDPSWTPSEPPPDPEARAADLQLAGQAVSAIRAAELSPEMAPEVQALLGLGSMLEKHGSQRREAAVSATATPATCSTGYRHYLEVHAVQGPTVGTEHSAVYWASYYTSASCTDLLMGWGQSCNHGSCALDGNMGYLRCTWESGLRSNIYPPFQNSYSGACSTPYDALSGWRPWPQSPVSGHNCNDDSYFQVYNIRNNTTYSTSSGPNSVCNDGAMHNRAPPCDGNF